MSNQKNKRKKSLNRAMRERLKRRSPPPPSSATLRFRAMLGDLGIPRLFAGGLGRGERAGSI